jgi:hypothetical protein
MAGRVFLAACAAFSMFAAAPSIAGRTAIDMNDAGSIYAHLSGYCDYNGDDCNGGSGIVLPYTVSIGGAGFTDQVFVHGNGLLSFGAPFDFPSNQDVLDSIYDQNMNSGAGPSLTDYGLTLVSPGQSNTLFDDRGIATFYQTGSIAGVAATGAIKASWYICSAPSAPGVCPPSGVYSVTLTPTNGGYAGHFDFSTGSPEGSDRGYVSGGVFTPTGNDFFLPAVFNGFAAPVPEPASWAMMVAGFGLAGAAMRRRNGQPIRSFG